MAISVIQLGTPRRRGEGIRFGTVRRPPRGVFKKDVASDDWYDIWLPTLAPSARLLSSTRASQSPNAGETFRKRFRAEMSRAEARHVLDALAALSHTTNFSIGCYCAEESHCHRRVLRELLVERRAKMR